jgi:anti-sigma B factor antagonist
MAERRFPVRGEVDLASAGELQDELLAIVNASSDDVVIDCTGLEFVDSTGIAVFVHTQRILELQQRQLRVVNLSGMARRAFDLLGLSGVLSIEPETPQRRVS